MKRLSLLVVVLCLGISCVAWIDYDDEVVRKEPVFGKEFQGFALLLSTEKVEFEQGSGELIHVALRNNTDAVSVVPEPGGEARLRPADHPRRQGRGHESGIAESAHGGATAAVRQGNRQGHRGTRQRRL